MVNEGDQFTFNHSLRDEHGNQARAGTVLEVTDTEFYPPDSIYYKLCSTEPATAFTGDWLSAENLHEQVKYGLAKAVRPPAFAWHPDGRITKSQNAYM